MGELVGDELVGELIVAIAELIQQLLVRLHRSGGFSRRELQRIRKLLERNQVYLLRSWSEYFSYRTEGSEGAEPQCH
jgi:hypothetical protein